MEFSAQGSICGDTANAAQDGFERPAVFAVGEEDFAGAARLRAVVPALEQREMALADGRRGRARWLGAARLRASARFEAGIRASPRGEAWRSSARCSFGTAQVR